MKKFYSLIILLGCLNLTHAQFIDTLLFENFQVNPFAAMDSMATGDNTNWVNFDQDGIETAFLTEESKQWFWGENFVDPVDPNTGETNYIATSLSFLQNSAPGNRNWMILPPMDITDDSYMLHWSSAPGQLPRFMDGYTVVLSTGGNDIATDFTNTLFDAASMDVITGDGNSTDFSNFTFTPGYQHADGGTLTEYIFDGGGTVLRARLEPHSVSLADYLGETVYIAFLHNSDDDERIGLDDILLTREVSSNTNEAAIQSLRMECYPNPVDHRMNLVFRLNEKSNVSFQIINAAGQLVKSQLMGTLGSGHHQAKLLLNDLAAGAYFIRLQAGEVLATQAFLKK